MCLCLISDMFLICRINQEAGFWMIAFINCWKQRPHRWSVYRISVIISQSDLYLIDWCDIQCYGHFLMAVMMQFAVMNIVNMYKYLYIYRFYYLDIKSQ